MTNGRNDYAERAAQNEAMLRNAVEWLFADAEARTRHQSYGHQILEVHWEAGAIQSINIRQANTILRGRRANAPGSVVLTQDGSPVE
jgi:hypothetical protein